MTYIAVRSSHIQGLDYDEKARELTVAFKDGAQYTFQEVPKDLANAFANSSSPGRFLASNVTGKFQVGRKSGPPPKKKRPAKPNVHKKYK